MGVTCRIKDQVAVPKALQYLKIELQSLRAGLWYGCMRDGQVSVVIRGMLVHLEFSAKKIRRFVVIPGSCYFLSGQWTLGESSKRFGPGSFTQISCLAVGTEQNEGRPAASNAS